MSDDPDLARQAAHVILDGLTAAEPEGSDSDLDATQLAFTRLLEIDAIELLFDEDNEELELDISPLMQGVLLVVGRLVERLAEHSGTSTEDVVAALRGSLDT